MYNLIATSVRKPCWKVPTFRRNMLLPSSGFRYVGSGIGTDIYAGCKETGRETQSKGQHLPWNLMIAPHLETYRNIKASGLGKPYKNYFMFNVIFIIK
jgi:hypothetical protein